jgi:hypothetical protein
MRRFWMFVARQAWRRLGPEEYMSAAGYPLTSLAMPKDGGPRPMAVFAADDAQVMETVAVGVVMDAMQKRLPGQMEREAQAQHAEWASDVAGVPLGRRPDLWQ